MNNPVGAIFVCLFVLLVSSSTSTESSGITVDTEQDRLALDEPLESLELAITIDDVPITIDEELNHGKTQVQVSRLETARGIIASLQSHHVPSVYAFSYGEPAARDSNAMEILQLWVGSGNFLGNHTFSHKNLAETTAQAFIADIERMDLLLNTLSPTSAALKVFRYPFLTEGDNGEKRNKVRDYLASKRYRIAQVTVDYLDWAWTGAYMRCAATGDDHRLRWLRESVVKAARRHVRRSQKLAKHVLGRDIKHILLLHFSAFNAFTLPEVLSALKADGVKFVDLQTAMSDPVYQTDPDLPIPNGRTFLGQLVEMNHIADPYQEQVYAEEKLSELCKR